MKKNNTTVYCLIWAGILSMLLGFIVSCYHIQAKPKEFTPTQAKPKEFTMDMQGAYSSGGWHFATWHKRGTKMEDQNGCPCACLATGWSSYANMTNGFAHGITNINRFAAAVYREVYGDKSGAYPLFFVARVEDFLIKKFTGVGLYNKEKYDWDDDTKKWWDDVSEEELIEFYKKLEAKGEE